MTKLVVTKPKETALVVRHNRLIEARYRLTLQEQRILLWLFSEIDPQDTDFKKYRVRIADLAKFIGISDGGGRLYREIADVTGRLRKREIDLEDIERNVTIQATWIASAEYHWNEGQVDICLAPVLMPYLLDLKKNFTKIAPKYAISMKSSYAIRIYELLKQYAGLGSRLMTIDELR
jgi:plasmid replication initiation protein